MKMQFNCLKTVIKRYLWQWFLLLVIIFGVRILTLFLNSNFINLFSFYQLMGLYDVNMSFFDNLFFVFHVVFILYFSLSFWLFEMSNNPEYIAFRINIKQWLLYKYFLFIVTIILFKLFFIVCTFLLFYSQVEISLKSLIFNFSILINIPFFVLAILFVLKYSWSFLWIALITILEIVLILNEMIFGLILFVIVVFILSFKYLRIKDLLVYRDYKK